MLGEIGVMKRVVVAVLVMLAPEMGMAQSSCRGPEDLGKSQDAPPVIPHSFSYTEGLGLGCALGAEDPAVQEIQHIPYLACLRIGPVGLGDHSETVEANFGVANKIMPLDDKTAARVYFIHQTSKPLPYFVVTMREDTVVALQLRGANLEMPQSFSGLELGDSAQNVLDRLGPPSSHCPNSQGVDTWLYQPFPFAIELLDGVVVGVKMTMPNVRRE